MVKQSTILRCKECKSVTEMIIPSGDCGSIEEKYIVYEEQTEGEKEKTHKPVISRVDDAYVVNVGENDHPMEEDHYIAMIELVADGQIHRQYLSPGDKPQATFKIPEAEDLYAREFCTLHGVWRS